MKKMQKFGFATIIAGGLAASALGLSGAAQADIDHHAFINDITQDVYVPHVDTTVHQSRKSRTPRRGTRTAGAPSSCPPNEQG